MSRQACAYCWRTSVATILVKTWFGWREQWVPVCRDHLRTKSRQR